MSTIIVIPARGGSKGIPRKNLRPVAGNPLIYYSIEASIRSKANARVIVTTDDDEIALFAKRFGAQVIIRDPKLADDKTTLDPVILDAVQNAEHRFSEKYEFVVTVQPTSPLIIPQDIDGVIEKLADGQYDSVLTVVDDRHLCWTESEGKSVPAYKERVNRQQLPINFKETGAVIACTRGQINSGTRIGNKVAVYEVAHERSFDIDSIADLYLCEAMLNRKKIVFNVVGYPEVGLGHAFRAVMLANELVQYDLVFVCEERSTIAADYIRSHNYTVCIASNGEEKLAQTVLDLEPSLIINDMLDTSESFMGSLRKANIPLVNFEDMGPGASQASLVINALYPHQLPQENLLVGSKYFCLRDEFLYLGSHKPRKNVKEILLTFGGVDEGNITLNTLRAITPICIENDIAVKIVTGPGYGHGSELEEFIDATANLDCSLIKKTKKISEHMLEADLAFTSGGRTVLELAALQVPTVVICQNEREMTHTFASSENGVINLGHREHVKSSEISNVLTQLLTDYNLLTIMRTKMKSLNLKQGKKRVMARIKSLLN